MEITTALAGAAFVSNALGRLLRRNDSAEATGATRSEKPSDESAGSVEAMAALRDIVSQYDVTAISPRQFSEMIQGLHEAGALSDRQFQELSLVRLDLDLEGVSPDERIDLLDFYAEKLDDLRRAIEDFQDDPSGDPPAAVEPVQRRLEWLGKFAVLQSSPDALGLDALA